MENVNDINNREEQGPAGQTAAPLLSAAFLSGYFVTMRPYLMFLSGAVGVSGIAVAGHDSPWRVLVAFGVFFLSYGFGQALTDCFQTDTDSLSSPYRPLVRGAISKAHVIIVSLAGLALSALVLGLLNPLLLIVAALCVTGLATYTFFKRLWWAGPLYNAWIVMLLPVMGYLADPAGEETIIGDINTIRLLMGATLFSYANFVLVGYFKDITADRQTGYRTFPVVFGWKPARIVTDILMALGLAAGWGCLLVLNHDYDLDPLRLCAGGILMGAATVAGIAAQVLLHKTNREQDAHAPMSYSLRSIILLHLAVTATCMPSWIPYVLLYYGVFEIVFRLRPERSQI